MRTQSSGNTINLTTGELLSYAAVCALIVAGCLLGAAVVSVGSGASSLTLAAGALAVIGIGAVVCFVLELQWIVLVRFALIASFFFKCEANFYKIDEIEDPSGFNLSLTLLSALTLLIYDCFDTEDKPEEKVFPTSFSVLFGGLFACAAMSVLYNGSIMIGWFSLWSFSTSLLVAYVVASHFSRRDRLVQLVIGLAIGITFTGLVAFSQYMFEFPTNLSFFGTGTEEEQLGTQSQALARVPAFLRTPTGMAWHVTTLMPIVAAPLVCRVKNFYGWRKFALLTATLSGAMAVILSLSRGSWISLVVVFALLTLFGWYRLSQAEKKKYFVSVLGMLFLACLVLTPFSGRIYERLTQDDEGSALIRVPLMETAFRIIEDNPVFGIGINNYRKSMTKYDETSIFVSQVFPNPVHNIFAHVTAEVGIPGGMFFCLLFVAGFYECFKTMKSRDRFLYALAIGCAAGIVAFVISGMKEPGSLGSVRPPVRTLYFFLGTILAVSRLRRQLLF